MHALLHPVVGVLPEAVSLGPETAWWTSDPVVAAVLAAGLAVYATGAVRAWRRAGGPRGIAPAQVAAYAAGLTVLGIALLSPLDRASDTLFSAHMARHELLMLIAAPLIVLGRPGATAARALPRRWRGGLRRTARRPALQRAWQILTAPAVALALHAAARWLWHRPAAFGAALADDRVHALQHLTFFGTALLFWWTLIRGRYGRFGYGVGVVFVFFTMLHSGLLAALLGLADQPIPLADQQRAGLVMWVPAGVVMMAIGLALLAAWLGQSARAIGHTAHPGLAGVPPRVARSAP